MRTELVLAGAAVALVTATGTALAVGVSSDDANGTVERSMCDVTAAGAALSEADGVGGQRDAVQVVTHRLLELGNEACFAGFVVDEANGRLTSFWKGDLPDEARRYAGSRPEGVQVVVRLDARHSRAELRRAAARLHDAAVFDEVGGSGVSISPDGSGLDLWVAGERPPSRAQLATVVAVTGLPEADLTVTTGVGEIDTSVPPRIS